MKGARLKRVYILMIHSYKIWGKKLIYGNKNQFNYPLGIGVEWQIIKGHEETLRAIEMSIILIVMVSW